MSLPPRNRLIVALDVPEVIEADRIVDSIGAVASFYKVGMALA